MSDALPAFDALVRSRRSVRAFTQESVPDDVLGECLALALLAPSSHALSPWELLCVRQPGAVEDLRPLCLDQEAARQARCFVVALARPDRWRRNRDVVLAHWQALGNARRVRKYRHVVPLILEDGPFSVLAPLMLALRAAGWDSCPLEGFDEPRVKRRFGVPRAASVVMILAIGRRDPDHVPPRRVPVDPDLFVRWL